MGFFFSSFVVLMWFILLFCNIQIICVAKFSKNKIYLTLEKQFNISLDFNLVFVFHECRIVHVSSGLQKFLFCFWHQTETCNLWSQPRAAQLLHWMRLHLGGCAALMIALIIIQCDKIITLTQLVDVHGIFYRIFYRCGSHAEAPDERWQVHT